MVKDGGFWTVSIEGIMPGALYFYNLDGKDNPDPASCCQPHGDHGPSEVINHNAFLWQDSHWKGPNKKDLLVFEFDVDRLTESGTFHAAASKIEDIKSTKVNAVEFSPGFHAFAVNAAFGGPEGLKEFVNACHLNGLSVVLDPVYNLYEDHPPDYLLENVMYWLRYYHIDVLRICATPDFSEILQRVQEFSRQKQRQCHLIIGHSQENPDALQRI
jgi:maltooligosyltrehalose trehalohydrolase